MADTARKTSDLLDLAVVGAFRGISPQDVRDILVSIYGVYSGMYRAASSPPSQLTIALSSFPTYTPIKPMLTTMPGSNASSNLTDASITINTEGVYMVSFSMDFFFSGASGITVQIVLRKNASVLVNGLKMILVDRTGASPRDSGAIMGLVSLNSGDVLDVVATKLSGTGTDMRIRNTQFSVRKVG